MSLFPKNRSLNSFSIKCMPLCHYLIDFFFWYIITLILQNQGIILCLNTICESFHLLFLKVLNIKFINYVFAWIFGGSTSTGVTFIVVCLMYLLSLLSLLSFLKFLKNFPVAVEFFDLVILMWLLILLYILMNV